MDREKILEYARMSSGINRDLQMRAVGKRWNWHKIFESKRDKIIKQRDIEEMKERGE